MKVLPAQSHIPQRAIEVARRRVARLDAIVFPEKNAFVTLIQGEQALNTAKQQYEQTKGLEQEKAIAYY